MGVACDPLSLPFDEPLGIVAGPFSVTQRCFLGENLGKYAFDFQVDFHKKYKDNAKYSWSYLMDGHEFTTMVASYLDEDFK